MHDDRRTHHRPYRRLRLDSHGGLIAGVCAGLARWIGTDVALVRIAILVAAIFFPKLVLAGYLVTWFVLARRGPEGDLARPRR